MRGFRLKAKHVKFLLALICLAVLMAFGKGYEINNKNPSTDPTLTNTPILSPARKAHILFGDKTGGGHLHGAGKPCKSEFPKDWDEQKIIETVQATAANDNLPWRAEGNGNLVVENTVQSVRVRVVLSPDSKRIITAYPVNVPRNPCPAAANDN